MKFLSSYTLLVLAAISPLWPSASAAEQSQPRNQLLPRGNLHHSRVDRSLAISPAADPDDEEIIVHDDADLVPDPHHDHGMMAYGELACNANAAVNIESQACLDDALSFSTLVEAAMAQDAPTTFVVPCGACYTVDYTDGEVITLPHSGGMNVLGRLHFPPTANVVLNTTGVIIQGMLDIPQPLAPDNQVTITLYGTDNIFYYPHDTCGEGDGVGNIFDESSCPSRKDVGKKAIAVVGGKVNIQARDTTCASWTKLVAASADGMTFTVDPSFAKCLKAGHDVVFASEERSDSAHDLGTVASVDPTAGTITLTEPIVSRPNGFAATSILTSPQEEALAVEVAGLNRNVIFTSQDDDIDNPTHGGHMIIFHTPLIPQVIQGVEFSNMGQDGNLGRYPLHWHKSGDASGSVASKVSTPYLYKYQCL